MRDPLLPLEVLVDALQDRLPDLGLLASRPGMTVQRRDRLIQQIQERKSKLEKLKYGPLNWGMLRES